jgi:two-component system, cell cycle sensor histidine kinase and response regulator CckA
MKDEDKTKEQLIGELMELREENAKVSARKELARARREWEDIFQAIGHPTVILDPKHEVLGANLAALRATGLSKEEIMGKKCHEIFHGNERPPEGCPMEKMLTSCNFETLEMEMEALGGVFLVSCTPLLDDKGQLQKIIHIATDITVRKRAEEDMLKEKNFSEALIDSLPGIFYLFDDQGRFKRWNINFEEVSGYSRQEIAGMGPLDFFTDEDRTLVKKAIQTVFELGRSDVAADFLTKDKERIPYFLTGNRVRCADIPCLVGMGIDISQRKQAEEAFRSLVSNAPIGIFILQDGKFKLANPGFEDITGYSEKELLGKDPLMAIAPESREMVRAHVVSMLKQKNYVPIEFQITTKSGQLKWIIETVMSTNYNGKRAVLGYFMDVTERKHLEGQLIHAQKMEAVGRLAGGVAHDFNNILTAIVGYGDIIKLQLLNDDPLVRYVNEILKSADRAASLTRQLLTFSRKQIMQPVVFNLNSVITDMGKMLRRLIGEDIDFITNLDPELGPMEADPAQIEQVIMNLVVNARDAMPQGGKLTLETNIVYLDEEYAHAHLDATPGAYVVLAISDSGTGIDGETLSRIFEPYFTSKVEGKGTGLGLSIVYGIVKQSGGYISVYSEPRRGTTFRVYFPLVDKTIDKHRKREDSTATLQGTETILVVEDDDVVRILISKTLSIHGYNVLVARPGGEALRMCERHKGPIHLMLTDVVMPHMSGRELADRLAPLRTEMKVLYTSGYTEDAIVHHGVLNTGIPFIQKPFKPLALALKVRKVLDGYEQRSVKSHSVPPR